jgi:hypothetical protein
MPVASPPEIIGLDELIPAIVSQVGQDVFAAYRQAIDAGYAHATVLDWSPGCMRGDQPQAWLLDAFIVHLIRTDGIYRIRRRTHTTETVTVGDSDDRAYGPARGRGPA